MGATAQHTEGIGAEGKQSVSNHPGSYNPRCPRFKMETDITISSSKSGLLKGRTVDISEAGVAAMLTIEVSAGEIVELSFMLPHGPVTVCATVRQKRAFRYGFEFVVPNSVSETIRRTCRDLFVDQTLFAEVKI